MLEVCPWLNVVHIEERVCVCVCYTTMCVRVHGGGEESKPMAKIIVNVNV